MVLRSGYISAAVLIAASLLALDHLPEKKGDFCDSNISSYPLDATFGDRNCTSPTLKKMVTSSDLNQTLAPLSTEETNTTNWFYYRDFLTGMDTVYTYGTSAVIVVGSGVDYSLYWLFTSKEEREGSDANLSSTAENLVPEPTDSNASLQTFVTTNTGKTDLPEQLASRNPRKGERTFLMSKWFGQETISEGFLDTSNRSYIRLRGGYSYDMLGESDYVYTIAARIKIPRTKEKLDLIVGDETKNSSDLSLEGSDAERDENSIALGINEKSLFDLVDTRFRIGFSGITNPYAKVDFRHESLLGKWLFEPSQTFKYSYEAEFEEWTDLLFKKRIGERSLFSFLIQRSSQSRIRGMHYLVQPAVSFSLGEYGNLTPYAGMYGRTKEQPVTEEGYRPPSGIYRYAIGINWNKQSSSREYIVYRLQPMLYYDDRYGFQDNYALTALLEFYFGLRD